MGWFWARWELVPGSSGCDSCCGSAGSNPVSTALAKSLLFLNLYAALSGVSWRVRNSSTWTEQKEKVLGFSLCSQMGSNLHSHPLPSGQDSGNSVLPKDLFFLSSLHLGMATSTSQHSQHRHSRLLILCPSSKVSPHYNHMLSWNRYLTTWVWGLLTGYSQISRNKNPTFPPHRRPRIWGYSWISYVLLLTCFLLLAHHASKDRDCPSPYKWGTGTHLLPSTTPTPSKFLSLCKSYCDYHL